MSTAERLEKLHKDICFAVSPFTFMMVKRRYSPSVMRDMVTELERIVSELKEFLGEV